MARLKGQASKPMAISAEDINKFNIEYAEEKGIPPPGQTKALIPGQHPPEKNKKKKK
jgi:hypothetical protein